MIGGAGGALYVGKIFGAWKITDGLLICLLLAFVLDTLFAIGNLLQRIASRDDDYESPDYPDESS
jgi:hypothetical protein